MWPHGSGFADRLRPLFIVRPVEQRHTATEPVLLTNHGTPVATRRVEKGRNDSIRLCYRRMIIGLKEDPKPVLTFKKTSASLLNREFGHDISQLFLGHARRSVAQKHYIAEYDHRLDQPLLWLGRQYGLLDE